MATTVFALRFIGGLIGIALTAASLTVTTVYAQGSASGPTMRPAVLHTQDVTFQRRGALNHGRSDFHRVYLQAYETYRFRAVCDADCSDLDLRLRNSANVVVAEDVLSDDVPVFLFTPRISGPYYLEVLMYECSLNPCLYDVAADRW